MSIEEDRLRRAKQRVSDLKAFYQHIAVVVSFVGMALLIYLITGWDLTSGWGLLLFIPMVFLSLSLVIHGVVTWLGSFGWEERKIEELMRQGEKFKNQ